MSYRTYEVYSDSRIEWVGAAPSHWEVKPLLATGIQSKKSNKGMVENNLLSLSYGRIVPKDISAVDGLLPESFETYQVIEKGDIVFRFTDLQNDKRSLRSALVGERGIITSAYLAFTPEHVCSRFFSYQMRSFDKTKVFYALGSGLRQSLNYSDARRLPVLIPPPAEQKQIADFLDRETEQIDNLIAEQEGLVANLTERRKAVISHAVTKGLNPEAELRDSGLEWSRQIPAGWVVDRISHLFRLISSGTTPDNDDLVGEDGDVCWVTTGELRENYISGTRQAVSFEIVQRTPTLKVYPPGTLLIAMYGATIGRLGILNVPACTNQACCAMSGPLGVETRFIYFAFQGALEHIMLLASGGGQPNINQDKVRSFRIPVPPLPEQREIVAYLENQTALIAELIEEAKALIDLLKERRSALISAAVTGKIDVRSEVLSRG